MPIGDRNDHTWRLEEWIDRGKNSFSHSLRVVEERRKSATKIEKAKNYDLDVQILLDIIRKLAPNERYDDRDCCKSRLEPMVQEVEEVFRKYGYDPYPPAMA